MKKKDLYDENGFYNVPQGQALVIHNNSNAFGQNIEYEDGMGSLDAAVGNASDAAVSLSRETIKPIIITL
jgi:hypothetical protein